MSESGFSWWGLYVAHSSIDKGESPSLSRCGRLTTIFKRQTVKISDGKVLHQAPNSSVISFL